MSTKKVAAIAGTGGALVAGVVGALVFGSGDASTARGHIGAGTSSVSLPGTGIVVTRAGDAGTLDAAGAQDGAVVAIVGGVPTLTAPSSGGGGLSVTTLYADDCTAESGSETASITGTDSSSTATLSGGAGSTTYYGTSGATAPRIVCPLPAGTVSVTAEVHTTTTTGTHTGAYRYLALGLRNAADGGAPAALWGIGCSDVASPNCYLGSLMGGANGGAVNTSIATGTAWFATSRWLRVAWQPEMPYLALQTGTGSGRPSVWQAQGTGYLPINSGGALGIPDTATATAVAVYLQSFGGGGASGVTFGLTVYVASR